MDEIDCCICLDNINNKNIKCVYQICCGQKIHKHCHDFLDDKCPMCRCSNSEKKENKIHQILIYTSVICFISTLILYIYFDHFIF